MRLESNTEWIRWGKEDPLWSVCTEPGRERGASSEWTEDEFYAAGESDWRDFLQAWQMYGLSTDSCLEIGCGAGRITRQLSSAFHCVYAVDVSPDMIARAKRATAAGNIEYKVTDGLALPLADSSVKAIFSTHVLQHLDSDQIVLAYFREMFRVLNAGGSVMIHVPLFDWPGLGRVATLLGIMHRVLLIASDSTAWIKRRMHIKMMRGTAINVRTLYSALVGIGFREIEFRTLATSRSHQMHSFVMARK